jgi:exopolysaccharide biosynthesis polyprenyl glycosylphosphotransferase
MLRRQGQLRVSLLVASDLLATTVALGGAYAIRFGAGLLPSPKPWDPSRYILALPPAVLLCVAVYALVGSYRPPRLRANVRWELRAVTAAVLSAALLLAAGLLIYRVRYQFSRGVLLIFPFVAVPAVYAGRRLARTGIEALHRRGIGVGRAILVGRGAPADTLAARLEEQPFLGVRIAARTEDPDAVVSLIAEHDVHQVIVAYPGGDPETARACRALAGEPIDVRVVPDLPGEATLNPDVSLLGGLPVVTLRETPFYGLSRFAKRGFDLAFGVLLFLLSVPLLLVLAIATLVTSGRPIFYLQERMGLDGRRFRIIKFRTMRRDAEAETGAVWATEGDPRRTPLGRFLRRFSLDELPQLLNVLGGQMSLVGPRPERPVFIESFRRMLPTYMLRHRIPAGLTGWAQIHGLRGESDVEERLRYDLAYLERWSILLDFEILLRTGWHVLFGKNAV